MRLFNKHHSRLLSAVCSIALVSGALIAGAPLASAADSDIVVTPDATNPILSYDGSAEVLDKQLVLYGQASLKFKWEVPTQNLANFGNGDKFTIELGSFFYNKEFGPQKLIPLSVNTGNKIEEIGKCAFERTKVTCTFDENVDRLKAGFHQFRGTVTVRVYVSDTTTETHVPITIQDQLVQVLLPKGPPKDGNTGVGIGRAPDLPADVYKAMTPAEHAKDNNYVIYMSGKKLKEKYDASNVEFRFNDNDMMVTFRDSLVGPDGQPDLAHTFKTKPHPTDPNKLVPENPEAWNVYSHRYDPASTNFQLEDLKPGRNTALRPNQATERAEVNPGEFELNVEFDKNTPHIAIITLKGPFKENFNYTIAYPTAVTNPKGVQEGSVFSNRIELIGTTSAFQLDKAYAASAEATAEAVPGFGFFKIEKRVAYSSAEQLIKPEHEVTVNYRYELPLPADTYNGWQAPGQLDADKIHGTASCVIHFRKTTSCLDRNGTAALLPKNSKVFITAADEDLSTVSQELRGLVWSTPTVKLPGNAQHAVISEQSSLTPVVVITNKAEVVKGKFSVKKLVQGLPAAVNAGPFSFTYSCQKGQQPAVTGRIDGVQANGANVESTESFELGSRCTITEVTPTKIDGYTLTPPAAKEVEITSSTQVVAAEFTNEYTQDKGTFAVKKTVSGQLDANVTVPQVDFDYSCVVPGKTAPETGTIREVVAGGQAKNVGQNFPVGTTCTVTENQDSAKITGYTLTAPEPKTVNITTKDQTVEVLFVNTYSKDMATFDVMKNVEGIGVANAPKFSFEYSCKAPGATDAQAQTGVIANVPGDGTKVGVGKSFPVNTQCTITEKLDSAQVEHHTLAAPQAQTLTLAEKNQTYTATFTNVYTLDQGTFAVKKVATGLGESVEAPKYSFTYTCTIPGQNAPVEGVISNVVAGGDAVSVGRDFPVRTACTITEKLADAQVRDYTLTEPQGQNIVIASKGQKVEAVFTNVYTLDKATFAVKKVTKGIPQGVTVPKFSFDYSCKLPGQKDEVKGSIKDVVAGAKATPVGESFPLHTVCTITEKAESAAIKGYTWTAPEPQEVKLEEKDQVLELEFVNTYKEEPSKPGKKVPSKVAKTGAFASSLGTIAVLLLGAGLIAIRQRRK